MLSEFEVPGQDCSPKSHEAGEAGKQKGAGCPRAESLPEGARPWQHRAALQGALGPSALLWAGHPHKAGADEPESGLHLSGARCGFTPTSSSSFLEPWKFALITAARQLIHSPQLQALTAKSRTWSSISQLPGAGHRQISTEGLLPALCHMRTGNKTAHTYSRAKGSQHCEQMKCQKQLKSRK